MRTGRPPIWNIAESFSEDAWTGVVEVTSKDRLLIPSSARKRVAWLAQGGDQAVLAEIKDDAVELRPWADAGAALVQRLLGVAETLPAPRRQDLVIATMDRYARLSIGADGRTVLPVHLSHHLGSHVSNAIRIVVRGGAIWLWSEARWAGSRQARYLDLDSLLERRAR